MFADSNTNSSAGSFSGITSNKTVTRIIDFVENLFQVFINKVKSSGKTSEEGLTQELVIILNKQSINTRFPFYFDKEHKNKKRRVDIGVVEVPLSDNTEEQPNILNVSPANELLSSSSDAIFCIEAKRLPTPGSGREQEYIVGDGGGIQRFKNKNHAPNLSSSAIIGYIQKETFSHWFTQINSWIDDLIKNNPTQWNEKDKLINFTSDLIKARSESKHLKVDGTYISLNHLWVSLI
jgi:hypothetical protein